MNIEELDMYIKGSVIITNDGWRLHGEHAMELAEKIVKNIDEGKGSVLAGDLIGLTMKAYYRMISVNWNTPKDKKISAIDDYMFMLITQHTMNGGSVTDDEVGRISSRYMSLVSQGLTG